MATWPALIADECVSGDGAETIGQALVDRVLVAASRRVTWYFAPVNFTTTLADATSRAFRMPPWARTGAVVTLTFLAFRGGAVSGNATFRLQQGATNGASLVTALTTSAAPYSVTITAPDDSWAGALVTFDLQAQRPASGVDADWTVQGRKIFLNFGVTPP